MKEKRFSVKSRLKSFEYAWNGLKLLLKEEHNSRIHLLFLVLVLSAGFFFQISRWEWVAILLASGFVFSFEIMNSAIENLADFRTQEENQIIKKVKDLSAAGVLISAICALSIGLIIFVPHIIKWIGISE